MGGWARTGGDDNGGGQNQHSEQARTGAATPDSAVAGDSRGAGWATGALPPLHSFTLFLLLATVIQPVHARSRTPTNKRNRIEPGRATSTHRTHTNMPRTGTNGCGDPKQCGSGYKQVRGCGEVHLRTVFRSFL